MQVRAGGPTGRADPADELALPDCIPHPHCVIGTVQECAVQAHAVIQHQQPTLKREGVFSRERNHAIGRGNKGRAAGAGRDIRTRMITAGRAVIDPLRSKPSRDAADNRPDHCLTPALRGVLNGARSIDLQQFFGASSGKFFAGGRAFAWTDGDPFNLPCPRRYGDGEVIQRSIGLLRHKVRYGAGIAIEGDEEAAIGCKRHPVTIEGEMRGPPGDRAARPAALNKSAGQRKLYGTGMGKYTSTTQGARTDQTAKDKCSAVHRWAGSAPA